MNTPLILYVPGLLPKPEASVHRQALRRCLLEGLRRHDSAIAEEIAANDRSFDLVAWTYDFYREHRDFDLDAKSLEVLLGHPDASEKDIVEASSPGKRLLRWLYRVGNLFPFLIPHLANERVELHLRDLMRYVHNRNNIPTHTRDGAACRAQHGFGHRVRCTVGNVPRCARRVAHRSPAHDGITPRSELPAAAHSRA
jgi:hypothetical protein